MSDAIKHLRSDILDKVPSSGICEYGELIVNYASGSGASFFTTLKSDNTFAKFHEDDYFLAKISEKQNNIPCSAMTSTTVTISPNIFYIWEEVEELDITLGEPEDNTIYNEYMFQFLQH